MRIRDSYIITLAISYYHCIKSKIMPKVISDEHAIKSDYRKLTGKRFSPDNTSSFCEKINWYKLNCRQSLMTVCADKYAVREYVISKGYSKILNTLYGVYARVEDIDISLLPERFIMKAAHGTHMSIVVKDKKHFKIRRAKMLMKSWLHQDIYWRGREWAYKDVPKRIIAEEYLEDADGELKDYKFFCFHGEPYYMQYDTGRLNGKHHRNYYAIDRSLTDISDGLPILSMEEFPLPETVYEQMISIAKDLSSDFEQVRIDFYYVNNKVYFGEMTFYDGNGTTVFTPDHWNYDFSKEWRII